ncbi:MAG TPA: AsmA-like C-terminal region-containing protein [Bryobacteraceae bacterium]|nr:AsmA-like C-terminal region-containing protein [Bryobacteraceae bacterium]
MAIATIERTRTSRGARWAIAAGALVVLLTIAAVIAVRSLKPWARNRVLEALRENYSSGLEVRELDFSLFPAARITGRGLVLRHKGRTDVPPLVAIEKFTAETGVRDLFEKPLRIRHVRLEGLRIHVQTGQNNGSHENDPNVSRTTSRLVIDEVIADGTRLETIPQSPNKQPLIWDIKQLTLHDTGPDRPMSFRATLSNAKPPGEIHTQGSFGPWQREQPRLTPVSGSYTFRDADLSDFPGLSGILSSDGKYQGVLQRIEVEGSTDTPKFELQVSRNPVHLTTKFQAVVDGTDGTTRLHPVEAHFGHSSLTARGIVDTTPGVPGNIISLDVNVPRSRLEDVLRLGVKGKASLTGVTSFHTKFLLSPGNKDISERLRLDGVFDVADARFSSPDSQDKLEKLSLRARGRKSDDGDEPVASNFKGHFQLRGGVMHFTDLSFRVPGIDIAMNGTYGLGNEQLDFHGTARTKAKLSQMTTGFKSFLLKAVDPFFAKQGAGAVLPIQITGTRDSPQFSRDRHHKTDSASSSQPR